MNLAVQGASATCSLFYSLVWMDIRLAIRDPGLCPGGFSEAPRTPEWSLDWGQHSHGCPPGRAVLSLRASCAGNGMHTLPRRLLFSFKLENKTLVWQIVEEVRSMSLKLPTL